MARKTIERPAQVVASGSAQMYKEDKGTLVQVRTAAQVGEKTQRSCSLGTAACGYTGFQFGDVQPDGAVPTDVLCTNPNVCGNSNEQLQTALNRL